MPRITPLLLCLSLAPCWGVESTDVRLHIEVGLEPEYELDFLGISEEAEFDQAFGLRLAMIQPLEVLTTGDLIAVISLGLTDAREDDSEAITGDLVYQSVTFRYGFGYRAELGDAIAIDAYPYIGIGWANFELGDLGDDPGLQWELGAQVEIAATFNTWQLGALASYGYHVSDHTIAGTDIDLVQLGPVVGGFVGYRF